MTDTLVQFRLAGTTAILTLNRPEQRNALDEEALHQLRTHIHRIASDRGIRAVVVTGSGDRAFCAGADIRHMGAMDAGAGSAWSRLGQDALAELEDLTKPVIAAVNGVAVGGGCELALACDVRVMAEGARIGLPETHLGIIPGWGGTQRLPRLVGVAHALDLILTGRLVDARDALGMGLVHATAPGAAEAVGWALQYADRFASMAPLAIAHAKRAVRAGIGAFSREAEGVEADLFGRAFATKDAREGLAAFAAKRAPLFRGE
jgi:enoyl-CoA hydratase/carnithine racemase